MKVRFRNALFSAAAVSASLSNDFAIAGAWTLPEGEGLTISKAEYVTASASFDGAGNPAPGKFRKLHMEAYAEYGLTDAITLVGQIDYDTSWLETEGEPAISDGFGRFSIWGRARLWRGQTDVASIQAGLEIAGDRAGVNLPALGAEPSAVSARALFGRGFSTALGAGFLDLQAGALFRDEDAPTQAEFDLTAGHWFWDDLLVMGQLFTTYSVERRDADPLDYDQTKGTLSVGWRSAETTTLVLGASADLATRRLEPTRSISLSLWKSF